MKVVIPRESYDLVVLRPEDTDETSIGEKLAVTNFLAEDPEYGTWWNPDGNNEAGVGVFVSSDEQCSEVEGVSYEDCGYKIFGAQSRQAACDKLIQFLRDGATSIAIKNAIQEAISKAMKNSEVADIEAYITMQSESSFWSNPFFLHAIAISHSKKLFIWHKSEEGSLLKEEDHQIFFPKPGPAENKKFERVDIVLEADNKFTQIKVPLRLLDKRSPFAHWFVICEKEGGGKNFKDRIIACSRVVMATVGSSETDLEPHESLAYQDFIRSLEAAPSESLASQLLTKPGDYVELNRCRVSIPSKGYLRQIFNEIFHYLYEKKLNKHVFTTPRIFADDRRNPVKYVLENMVGFCTEGSPPFKYSVDDPEVCQLYILSLAKLKKMFERPKAKYSDGLVHNRAAVDAIREKLEKNLASITGGTRVRVR